MNGFRVTGPNWGGGVLSNFTNCFAFEVNRNEGLESHFGSSYVTTTDSATQTVFQVSMGATGDPSYAGVFVELTTEGLQNNHGEGIVTSQYQIINNAGTPTVYRIATNANGVNGAAISHGASVLGQIVSFTCTTNGGAYSTMRTTVRVQGTYYTVNY
jgi:hypothetical protein